MLACRFLDAFARFRAAYPDHLVISYINCSAAIKAQSDIICTSSNAEAIIRQIPEDQPIIFAPDRNLGRYLQRVTGRDLILWDGTCIVHERFSEQKIVQLKVRYPDALVLAHPECDEVILQHADYVGSTSGIRAFARQSSARRFIVATEPGILHQMQKDNPDKEFIPAPADDGCACNECPHMRLNTLEKIYQCLRDETPEIVLDETLRQQALRPIQRMLEMSRAIAA